MIQGRVTGDKVREVGRGQRMWDLAWTLICPFRKVGEPLEELEKNDKI